MSAPALSIGELSRRTGLTPATLRVWESRYGFPVPGRSAGGQRSYAVDVVDQLHQVMADREAGLALPAAIERARAASTTPAPSLHAFLRRRAPSLPTHQLTKRGVAALTRALEDEGHSRAGRPRVMAASFQSTVHYGRARDRWSDLTTGARTALVFADFPEPDTGSWPVEIPIGTDHPLHREWFVIWYGDRYTACLSGRELPGQAGRPNPERVLETIWTVEGRLVAEAARAVLGVADDLVPGLGLDAETIGEEHLGAAEELDIVYALTNRMVAHLAPSRV